MTRNNVRSTFDAAPLRTPVGRAGASDSVLIISAIVFVARRFL